MSHSLQPGSRNFFCDHCGGEISIPFDLPPTTAPCPHCGAELTSPPPPEAEGIERDPSAEPPPELPAELEDLTVEAPSEPVETPATELDPVEGNKESEEIAEAGPGAIAHPAQATEQGLGLETVSVENAVPRRETVSPVRIGDEAAPDEGAVGAGPAKKMAPNLLFLVVLIVLAGLVALAVYFLRAGSDRERPEKGERAAMDTNEFIRDGWKGVATERLRKFLSAETVEEKAKHVIGGQSRLAAMRKFYETTPLDESDTPIEVFSHYDLELEDRERGIYLMIYQRPAQFAMREFFRPVASLEVHYRLEEQDPLLGSVAALGNYAMDPAQAMVFFKQEGFDLFIDWDVYVQTKYRTLGKFCELPKPGTKEVFRVEAQEDMPNVPEGDSMRTYRLADPGNEEDYAKVSVAEDSEIGKILAPLNWIGTPDGAMATQTATVELAWTREEIPRLELSRVLCWEFLGLGGEVGNTVPGRQSASEAKSAAGEEAPSP